MPPLIAEFRRRVEFTNPALTAQVLIIPPCGSRNGESLLFEVGLLMAMDLNEAMADLGGGPDRAAIRAALVDDGGWLRDDAALLSRLGLRPDAANVVDFGPVALSRVCAAHQRESSERRRLEDMAQANFAAQTQTHAAVLDVLEADSLSDLANRVDALARRRFGLVVGVVAIEGGETPAGWLTLVEGQTDLLLGEDRLGRLGAVPTAAGLFGAHAPAIGSVALARLSLWRPARVGVMALGAFEPDAFTDDMGDELVGFLARVVERTAQRWPKP